MRKIEVILMLLLSSINDLLYNPINIIRKESKSKFTQKLFIARNNLVPIINVFYFIVIIRG